MSVKIKVSYNTDQELAGVIRLLTPALIDYKVSRNKDGRYKKAYAELNSDCLEMSRYEPVSPTLKGKC